MECERCGKEDAFETENPYARAMSYDGDSPDYEPQMIIICHDCYGNLLGDI